jgi:adenylate cyclase, class 2
MHEVEIKFRVTSIPSLTEGLHRHGFHLKTARTHEMNTIFDQPDGSLRKGGELLRLRRYGDLWTVTYKAKAVVGRHKSRKEIETTVADGPAFQEILEALGYRPGFAYEKFRTEFADSHGHVVIDETPIGNFGEIEGEPGWIDSVARHLEIAPESYLTDSYAGLFMQWKRATGSQAEKMLFAEVG